MGVLAHGVASELDGGKEINAETQDSTGQDLRDVQETVQQESKDVREHSGEKDWVGNCGAHAEFVGWWKVEPDVGRVTDISRNRVASLKALGNGQVPLTAAFAWRILGGP